MFGYICLEKTSDGSKLFTSKQPNENSIIYIDFISVNKVLPLIVIHLNQTYNNYKNVEADILIIEIVKYVSLMFMTYHIMKNTLVVFGFKC